MKIENKIKRNIRKIENTASMRLYEGDSDYLGQLVEMAKMSLEVINYLKSQNSEFNIKRK